MFTGLIEELGRVDKIRHKGTSLHLTVGASTVLEDINVGASIAVNGVCLTVTDFSRESFSVDIVPETLARTILSGLKVGEKVNLERAIKAGERLGGHLVSGHIDGTGRIKERRTQGDNLILRIGISGELSKYMIPQGSIAVDGISLTIAECGRDSFTVAVIPHTSRETTLRFKTRGSEVNIEVDSLGKYVERLMNFREIKKAGITIDSLTEQGFK
jgi:riboflavin synthase